MDNQNEQPNQLNIEISEEVSEGAYANLAIIKAHPKSFPKKGRTFESPL